MDRRRREDPYLQAQIKARRAAFEAKREVVVKARQKAYGDPVRGITTPFVQSLDNALPVGETPLYSGQEIENPPIYTPSNPFIPEPTTESYLNHYLKPEQIETSIKRSEIMAATPALGISGDSAANIFDETEEERAGKHHTAVEAINRIVALGNANSKDRLKANTQRIVDTFGRHQTDNILPPRAPVLHSPFTPGLPKATPDAPVAETQYARLRAGPDTGSSEVQIGILTAKIRTLATNLRRDGKHDKINKRNLRLLVHRRQKLLQYLRRKERGGPRWQRCIELLGLTEGTWRGEISL